MYRRHFKVLSRIKLFVFLVLLFAACDKGLFPPEIPRIALNFPITPEGGDPTGAWVPHTTNPVDVGILDEEILSYLDSLVINTELSGEFFFSAAESCFVHAFMTMHALAYPQGITTPITYSIFDTIYGEGHYQVIDDVALHLPVKSTNFRLDTLGFTAHQNDLNFITLPNTFDYMGIMEIPLYFVFHLVRSNEKALSKTESTFHLYHK